MYNYHVRDNMMPLTTIITDVIIMIIKNPSELGRVIRSRRKQRGLTQRQLADACGCSIMYLSNLERGKATAELGIALRIVNMLGLDVEVVERGLR